MFPGQGMEDEPILLTAKSVTFYNIQVHASSTELEFLKSLWGLGTGEE